MKVGEWARFTKYSHYTDDKTTYIGVAEEGFSKSLKIRVNDKKFFFDNEVDIIKTSPNLENLLEVGDIVHGEIEHLYGDEIQIRKYERTIKTVIDIKNIKEMLTDWGGLFITAIELHENRQKQVIS